MYRRHIIAQFKNMFDIADIYGERRRSGLVGNPLLWKKLLAKVHDTHAMGNMID
jgi:hypothetical protein